MECGGGTNPYETFDVVVEDQPDLYDVLGKECILALCEELHRSEDAAQSESCGVRFSHLNNKYFDGRLEDYRVRVVYDLWFWLSEHSHIDLAGRQIFLQVTKDACFYDVDCLLIHHMAHAATGTTTDDDHEWQREMERLKNLGAPVEQ
jgi:hypothetical protein